jgi:hypothetical protein
MTRKLMVLGLAAVLVIAVAIPVVAQDRVITPKLQKISKRALKKSGTALRTSRAALREAQLAMQQAQTPRVVSTPAPAAAAGQPVQPVPPVPPVQPTVSPLPISTATAAGTVSTPSEEFVALAGGPSLTVTVPASGLIEVWAQAAINEDGAVSLYEDGKSMPGQAELCGPEGAGALFAVEASFSEPILIGTPAGPGFGLCGNQGAPAPVLFQTTPGTHTYELRYADCGCGGEDPTFSDRRLFVGPRP